MRELRRRFRLAWRALQGEKLVPRPWTPAVEGDQVGLIRQRPGHFWIRGVMTSTPVKVEWR